MSVFETIAVVRGRLVFAEEHRSRLVCACEAAGMVAPYFHWPAVPVRDGVLRVYVTVGDGGPLDPAEDSRCFALFEEIEFPRVGTTLRVMMSAAPVPCVLGGWKTGNYWPNVQALQAARGQGCDEALVFNSQAALVGGAMANVVIGTGGRFLTPARDAGARDGVLLSWVRGRLSVEEAWLSIADVKSADEVFLTNSRIGVVPVRDLDGRTLPSMQEGERLAARYREEVLEA